MMLSWQIKNTIVKIILHVKYDIFLDLKLNASHRNNTAIV